MPQSQHEKRKALVSRGTGIGWSSWMYGKGQTETRLIRKMALFDVLLIDAIEQGVLSEAHVEQFRLRLTERFPRAQFVLDDWRNLRVVEVDEPFRIEERDGYEHVIRLSDDLDSYY